MLFTRQQAELTPIDQKAAMASAPMKYRVDGQVDWGNMWDSYCALALDGGPPHRETLLTGPELVDTGHENYRFAVAEIVRGIREVCGLATAEVRAGWIGIECASPVMADWLAEAINEENVEAKAEDSRLLVPVAEYYTLKGEIKNVITAVAKTSHYWAEHLPGEVKWTLAMQRQVRAFKRRLLEAVNRLPDF